MSASGDAALKNIIPKLKDDIYRVAASIFMFPVSPSADKMTDTLTKTIPIRVFFKPIVNKLLTTESPSKSTWNDVLSATVFQKFGKASLPNFPTTQSLNVEGFYGSFNPDLVTSTATNYVTITQVNFKLVRHTFIYLCRCLGNQRNCSVEAARVQKDISCMPRIRGVVLW